MALLSAKGHVGAEVHADATSLSANVYIAAL